MKTQKARGHGCTFIFTFSPLWFVPLIFTENVIRESSCLGNMLKFYKFYTGFQANNDPAYFLAISAKPFRGERYSWSLQKTRTWETWFASTKILDAYYMRRYCRIPNYIFFLTINKRKVSEERELMFWEEHYTVSTRLLWLPRTHSSIPHWVGG